MNVIIADDEPLALVELKSIIPWSDFNFTITGEARNGRMVLDILQSSDIDLVILDINMPGLTGLEVIEECNRLEYDLEFLIISAYSDYHLVRKAFKLGASDYILKEELEPETIIPVIKKIQGRINKKNITRSTDTETDNNTKQIYNFLNFGTDIPDDILPNNRLYKLLKLETLEHTDDTYGLSSIIKLHLDKYQLNYHIINNSVDLFVLIESDEGDKLLTDNYKQIKKSIKLDIKAYMNQTVIFTDSEVLLEKKSLKSEYDKIKDLHQFKSGGISKVVKYLTRNYKDQELNLDTLCSISGLSKSHLSTQFKQEVGIGYKEYLNEIRISHAITLLHTTELLVQDIFEEVGFSNVEHFSRTFKSRTGMSPSTFNRYLSN